MQLACEQHCTVPCSSGPQTVCFVVRLNSADVCAFWTVFCILVLAWSVLWWRFVLCRVHVQFSCGFGACFCTVDSRGTLLWINARKSLPPLHAGITQSDVYMGSSALQSERFQQAASAHLVMLMVCFVLALFACFGPFFRCETSCGTNKPRNLCTTGLAR